MRPGTLVDNRYEVLAHVAVGGMGTVFRATDIVTNADVALKILTRTEDDGASRFTRECEVLSSIAFPGLVRYVGHGISDGQPYLAMGWIEGDTLANRLRNGVLSVEDALRMTQRLARTAGGLHERGILHRDLKPQNILLNHDSPSDPIIVDLGIAKRRGARELTKAGLMVGSPGFMAPEQVRGENDVDARADVFALGCILFCALTGRSPFDGKDPLAILLRIAMEEAPRLSSLLPDARPDVEALLVDLLSQDRGRRPVDGHALADRLSLLGDDDTTTHDDWAAETVPRAPALRAPTASSETDSISAGSGSPDLLSRHEGRVSTGERRFACLVVCRVAEEAQLSKTEMNRRWQTLRSWLEVLRAEPTILPDGTLLVSFSGKQAEAPTDLALRGVRAGLAVSRAFPGCLSIVAFGRSLDKAASFAGETIERAVGMFSAIVDAKEGHGLVVDEIAGSLVEPHFVLAPIRLPDLEVRAYSISRERADGETRPLLGKLRSFVGRAADLAFLDKAFRRTLEGTPQHVLVTGDTGSGKTRLASELIHSLAPQGVRVWALKGDAVRAGSAYGLVAPLIHRLAGLERGASHEQLFLKLRDRLTVSSGSDGTRVAEFLVEMVGVPRLSGSSETLLAARLDVNLMHDQMTRAFVDLCSHEATLGPLVLCVDDLQWSDSSSRHLIESVLRSGAKIFFLALGRTGLGPPWDTRGLSVTEHRLGPLDPKASLRLVLESLGEGYPLKSAEQIVSQSDGNPFFLEELIRAAGALPISVLAAIETRLLAESADARRVLRAASVFGDRFPADGLSDLVGDIGLPAVLDRLVEAELIEPMLETTHTDTREYAFGQTLTREAAYGMLLPEDRKEAHALVGAWLEANGESDARVLARHFECAESTARAAHHYLRAAEHALVGGDFAAVLECARRGLANDASSDKRARLESLVAQSAFWRNDNVLALESAKRALVETPRDSIEFCDLASVAVAAAGRLTDLNELDRLVETVVQSIALTAHLPPGAPMKLLSQCAIELVLHGRYARADQVLATMSAVERRANHSLDHVSRAYLGRARGWRALSAGNPGAFGTFMEESAEHFRAILDRRNEVISLGNVGYAELCLGNVEGALEKLEWVLEHARALGLHQVLPSAEEHVGVAHYWLGDFARAESHLRSASLTFQRSAETRSFAQTLSHIALCALARGDTDAAEREARLALTYVNARSPARAMVLASLAIVLLERSALAHEEALGLAREAKVIVGELGGIEEGEALVHLAYARALHAVGDHDAARTAILSAKRRLVERASRIAPISAQANFLLRIPAHTETIDAAREWLGES